MILDDLFEQKPLPAHIRPSDLPPGMRPRLTMRDVERERPQGAYRYRVIPGAPGESPKDFLDLPGAEQYAQAVRGRVQPLEEQADPDVQRGMTNLNTIEKQLNTNMKVVMQNETGKPAYQIELPVDKQWLISHAQEWIDAGKQNDLYKLMGTNRGFEFLLAAWQKEDVLRHKRAKDVRPEEPDLFGTSQAGAPKAPRYQDESQHGQKKRTEVTEAPKGAAARTQRMMTQIRARQPQASSDLEALAYELQDAEKRDSEEINKLEREVDSLETDIKGELQKRVATLTRRKGGVQQAAAADTKIDATLDQLTRVNDQQQRDIDDLTKAVASLGRRSATIRLATDRTAATPAAAAPAAAPAMPASTRSRAIDQAVADLTKTAKGGEMTKTPTGMIHRAASTAADADSLQSVQAAVPADLQKGSDVATSDLRSRFAIPQDQDTQFQQRQQAESVAEGWWQQFKGDVGTVAGLAGQALAQRDAERQAQRTASKAAPKVAMRPWQSFKKGYAAASAPVQQPTPQTPVALAPGAPAEPTAAQYSQPVGFGAGDMWVKGPQGWVDARTKKRAPSAERVAALDKMLQQSIQSAQEISEKKKPQPTNPDLWSRAKSAARSKFDVYPSAYANAWAAKWYKSKGGGWRMGKPKKK